MPDSLGPLPIIGVSAVTLGDPSPGTVPVLAVEASGHLDLARLQSRELLLSLSSAGRVILTVAPLGEDGAFDNATALPVLIPDARDVIKTTIAEVDSWAERVEQTSGDLA